VFPTPHIRFGKGMGLGVGGAIGGIPWVALGPSARRDPGTGSVITQAAYPGLQWRTLRAQGAAGRAHGRDVE